MHIRLDSWPLPTTPSFSSLSPDAVALSSFQEEEDSALDIHVGPPVAVQEGLALVDEFPLTASPSGRVNLV